MAKMAPGKMKALGSPDLYTIGWIAALPIERAAAAAMLDEEHAQPEGFSRNPNDKNSYTWGRIGDHNIVIASLKAGVHGLVSASVTASNLSSSLPSIRIGLLVGIGGGIPRPNDGYDIRLGDVIVSQPDGTTGGVCQYDFVKAKPGNRRERKGFLAPPPDVLLHAVANIQSAHELRDSEIPNFLEEMQRQYPKMAKKTKQSPGYVHQGFANDRLFESSYNHKSSQHEGCKSCEVAQEVERDERESMDPEIHYGIIASGNTLVKDGSARDQIVAEVGEECICFEMEAAGLMNEFPCLVIRGVCDYADSHKNDQWQRYACATAAAYAKELLAYVPEADVRETKKVSEILELVDHKLDIMQQASQAVEAKVESLIVIDRDQKLRKWLAAPDPNTNANHARDLRHEGTGTWLLETSTFQEWMSGTNRHLWLRGIAGCGKTVLSTTVLDHLAKTDDRIILSFFFDFGDTTKQTKDSLLRSIALQLYQRGCSLVAAHLDDSFRAHQDGELKPTTATLEELVYELLTAQQRVVIILDALDESTKRDEVIRWIKRIHENLKFVQMLYTSREAVEFLNAFPSVIGEKCCLSIYAEATDRDIASYVSARLQTQPEFTEKALSGDILERISNEVGSGASGMFRWAACQLDSLAKSPSLNELEQQLDSLPLDLPDTYGHMLDSIPHRYRERAMRLLQFLVFSKRPLNLQEGVEVFATEIQGERPSFKPERRLFNHNDVLRHCSSFISLINAARGWDGRAVQELHLAHFSVKEYLLVHVQVINWMDASIAITKTLLTYIRDIPVNYRGYDTYEDFPLASYAAEAWIEFAVIAESSEDVSMMIVSFLQREETFKKWVSLRSSRDSGGSYFFHACAAGLKAVVSLLIDEGIHIDEKQCGNFGNPLQVASFHGHLEIVRLLAVAGTDVNAEGGEYGTALQAACCRGHLDIVRLLIKHNARINTQSGRYGNALVAASHGNHMKVVELLLSSQAAINAGEASELGNSLVVACAKGHFDLVRLLVEKGADLQTRSGTHAGPLMAACNSWGDHTDIVQLLLDHGVDIHVKGGEFGSPLQAAIHRGNGGVVALLLDRGADANAPGGKYGSTLLAACHHWAPIIHIFELLVHHGADVNATDDRGTTPLHKASLDGDVRKVAALLQLGSNIEAKDNQGRTAFHHASAMGSVVMLKLLLDAESYDESTDDDEETPLLLALESGREDVAKLLPQNGANIGSTDNDGQMLALYRRNREVIKVLLSNGANVDSTDNYGQTPLQLATWGGAQKGGQPTY